MKFIHLTDTHVVGGGRTLFGADPAERLARAVASINSEHGDAAFVVLTGDMTHWGDAEAYAAFRAEIDRLAMPVHLMVGNHDDTEAFHAAFPEAPRDEAGFVQGTVETPFGLFLLLDTRLPGSSAGQYCAARRAWLRARLEESEGPVILFMHHPPFATGIGPMDAIRLEEAEAFHEVIAPHKPRIRHLFYGHLHRPIFGNWRGISHSCMRGLNHQVALTLGPVGGEVIGNLEPPAYGVVLIDAEQIMIHMHAFSDASPRFPLAKPF
ncbi:MAG: phosphodiesterase [Roseovarius sp.]